MRINQNIAAFNSYRNLSATNTQLSKSLEKLSSGFRINRAADDAAGLVISEGLRAQVSGLRQATRNAQDGISVVQTAEGALTEMHAMLQRMRDLAVQAANDGSMSSAAKTAAQNEVVELRSELNRIAQTTKFGNVNLLDGSFGKTSGIQTGFVATGNDVQFAVGAELEVTIDGNSVVVALDNTARSATDAATYLQNQVRSALLADEDLAQYATYVSVSAKAVDGGHTLTISNASDQAVTLANETGTPLTTLGWGTTVDAATGSGGVFQVGANVGGGEQISVTIGDVSTGGLLSGLAAVDVSSDAAAAQVAIDSAIDQLSTIRGELGAKQNRFEHTIANLNVTVENLAASESRIRDTDMALEMVNFTRHQILAQAGTAMLAQANLAPQSVLSLLR